MMNCSISFSGVCMVSIPKFSTRTLATFLPTRIHPVVSWRSMLVNSCRCIVRYPVRGECRWYLLTTVCCIGTWRNLLSESRSHPTNLRIAPLFTALTTLSANANWPATLKGLLQGQMVNDAGKLVVIEELMYAIVEANGKITQLFIFLFIMIISQYFFFRTLK